MLLPPGPLDRDEAIQVADYLLPKLSRSVSFDVWTRKESGLLRTDRDTCSHCDDVLELARQLASLHSGISVTSYDFEKHSSRAEESNITLAPTTIVRGNQRSIRLVGLFSGLLFPVLLDIIWLVSQGRAPFTDEQRTILTDLTKDEIEIEAIITPYDPYSAHMARLLSAFAVETPLIKLELTEMAELPILAGQRAIDQVPITIINGKRFVGAWDEEPLLEQLQRVIIGNDEPVIREQVLSTPFLTEDQAIQQAREELERQQGIVGNVHSHSDHPTGNDPAGGLIVPGS
tara:strand:+ start:1697 stop:2560 length:864 start_codon:yes stop_codon:yes gene_type:complete